MRRADEGEPVKCGVACYHPRWARRLANPKLFCVVWCLAIVTQSITGIGLLTAVLSTIETRFQLESKDLGMLASAADIGGLIALAWLSYYGGICTLVFAIGTIAFGLPHFMTPAYEVDSGALTNGTQDKAKDVCTSNRTTSSKCTSDQGSSSSPYAGVFVLLFLAQFVLGIGQSPTLPLATTYVDDHVTKKALPFYLGFSYMTFSFGPPLGLFLGGFTLSRYVDIDKGIDPATLGLFQGSPLWVGAWWLGFFVMAGLLGLVASLLLLFPAALKQPKEENDNAEEDGNRMLPGMEIHDSPSSFDPAETLKQQAKDILLSLKKVLTNWSFMCITMASVSLSASVSTYSFLPKYMETQFDMHKSQASYLMGVNIPYGHSLNANVTLGGLPGGIALTSPCNADCGCRLDNYRPVCASDGITYFSGCHAGCHERHSFPGPGGIKLSNYSNCGCVTSRLPSITGGGTKQPAGIQTVMVASEGVTEYFASVWATANPEPIEPDGATIADATSLNVSQTDRSTVSVISELNSDTDLTSSVQIKAETFAFSIRCPTKCNSLAPFLALLSLNVISRSMIILPFMMTILRILSPDTKTFGVGVQSLLNRLLAYIPAPIYIGALIDRSCELWSFSCGVRGACLLYDMPMNRLLFIGVQVLFTSVTIALLLVAIRLYNHQESAEGKSQAPGLTTRDIATSMGSLAASISSLNNIGTRSHERYTREPLHDKLTDC
ncbi:solute carrier organic anion transporter family member 3A1-like [Branchiostoma lanceolatum]|uniref:solute carrier organic anion transporter family member 3A1-like n=1 Tax=Branchiostoma lanceolatum TaxID=7740 RepID=UPI003456120E